MRQGFQTEIKPCELLHSKLWSVSLLLVLMLGQTLQASLLHLTSTQEAAPQADALKLSEEGARLIEEGTQDALQQALKKFEEALPLWRKAGDRRREAYTLRYIGKIYSDLGQKLRALDYYNQTLPLLREVKDTRSEGAMLSSIGLIHDALGEKQTALEFYNRALPLLRAAGDHSDEAITLVNLGLAYNALGEKQRAINHYQQALAILRTHADQKIEAITLNNLGRLYDSLGEKQKALEYFGQALPIFQSLGDRHMEAVALTNIGFVYETLDERKITLGYYEYALKALRAAGDRFTEAQTLENMGRVHHSLKEFEKALEYFKQALEIQQAIGDRPSAAITLSDTGQTYDALGQTDKALDYYNRALQLSRAVEDKSVEATVLRRLAIVEERRGQFADARAKMEAALSIIESLRTRVVGQELRASYFSTVQEQFETYISLLMHMHRAEPAKGYDALALQANERARARSMIEMLNEAGANIRQGVAPALLNRERSLQQKLMTLAERQTRLLTENPLLRPGDESPAAKTIAQLKAELSNALTGYRQVEAEIRIASPRYAALTQPSPLSLREIQAQTLEPDSLLLEYSLGDEKSYLWAVTPDSMQSFELPSRAAIEGAAEQVLELLTARNLQVKFETPPEKRQRVERADKDYLQAATRLSDMLLLPVAEQLGKKRLLIVGDGMLNYIPFAALPMASSAAPEGYQPLIVEHEIVSLPSASTLGVLRRELLGRKTVAKTLAVIADPVFDKTDARVKLGRSEKNSATRGVDRERGAHLFQTSEDAPEETPPIQRLPYTRIEADAILSLVPASQSKKALDFDANRATAMSAELGQYRYVHFATHGILDSEYPELSGIVLSLVGRDGAEQDGFLWAHEVFNLRLPVEMVILSGCRTGLGKKIKGEGLVGLTRGFMYAGAARVMVSLWDISDEASA
ncbi:MAG: tetratricopeptide repeat protein, partial [Acidobacteria bacterium]|nr:tetratricopeptide repeat protein [Acidobacteriota bacterium]